MLALAVWLWFLLLPLFLFLGGIVIMVIVAVTVHRTKCPACGGRSLRPADLPGRFGRNEDASGTWMYCYCRKCGAAFKYRHSKWVQLTETEKSQLVHS